MAIQQRIPKRSHPEFMCFQCEQWKNTQLDWGMCIWENHNGEIISEEFKYAYEKGCGMWCPRKYF